VEVSVVPARPITVLTALAAFAGVAGGVWHLHRVRRALDAERAARRLTAGMHQRDMQAYAIRLNRAIGARAVLTEADLILDTALAAHHNPEGGRP
jgi:hypothetical protein